MKYQLQNFNAATGQYENIGRSDNPGVLADRARAHPLVFKSWRVTSPDQRQLPLAPKVLSWKQLHRGRNHRRQNSPEHIAKLAADWYIERLRRDAPVTVYHWPDRGGLPSRYLATLREKMTGFARCNWVELDPATAFEVKP